MTEKFNKCIFFVLKQEGGYSNNPSDPGGETNYGISRKSYPNEDIKNMTVERAKEIYYRDFWVPMFCEQIQSLGLALALFDAGVNCGTVTARNWFEVGMSMDRFAMKRIRYYEKICQKYPKLKVFLLGWCIRTVEIWLTGEKL